MKPKSLYLLLITALAISGCTGTLSVDANLSRPLTENTSSNNSPVQQASTPPLKSNVSVSTVQVIPERMVIEVGRDTKAAGTVRYADNTADSNLIWSSSDNTIASVESTSGVISAIKPGEVTIIATAVGDSNKRAGIQVSIKDVASSPALVTLEPNNLDLSVGETGTLTAKVILDSAESSPNIRWRSSNPNIATVRGTGSTATVIGIKAGSADIIAEAESDTTRTAIAKITVK